VFDETSQNEKEEEGISLIRSGGKKSSVVAPQPSQTHSRTNL
jgi:hypothetical protein